MFKTTIPLVAACAALVACGNAAEEADEPIVSGVSDAMANAANGTAGTYEVVMADGTVITQTLRADGTYSDVADGEVTETGTWRADADRLCYDPEGDGAEQCFEGGAAGPDGSFQTRDGDGEIVMTVRRIGDETVATEPTA